MKLNTLVASLMLIGGVVTAHAQTDAGTIQRDVNQQNRIEQGLKNGSLTTREAGRLEREEARIDRQQARDLKDGTLTPKERARLRREQNQASRDINRLENNGARGDPNSEASKRMQADVQRNANQEQRIENGVRSGQLNNEQAGKLEAGQARIDRAEARAAKNGYVGAGEQRHIQERENHQSKRIHALKN